MKLGVIGTSWISAQFIKAAQQTGDFELTALYSRRLETAENFVSPLTEKFVACFDDLSAFVETDVEVIYIASPNSMHFEQARAALTADKSVIVEKPAFSTPQELTGILALAAERKLFFFEAARNIHEANFQRIKEFLIEKTVTGADLTYAKYSSKMPALLRGELPNKWNPAMSGGILADLGVYLLYFTLGLFGKPTKASYFPRLLGTGADVSGTGLLSYPDFDVTLKMGGNLTSYLPSEIYTTDGTLVLNGVEASSEAKFIQFDGKKTTLTLRQPADNPLYEEAQDFAKILSADDIRDSDYRALLTLAQEVNAVSHSMRESAGITFPSAN